MLSVFFGAFLESNLGYHDAAYAVQIIKNAFESTDFFK